jgi:glycosyltransferase involved in cell wall biosynthesis
MADLILKKDRKLYKWNKKYSRNKIQKGEFDILHATYFDHYDLDKIPKKVVLTVYDMIHELMPEFFDANNKDAENKKAWVDRADKIIAISASTKQDLIRIHHINPDKIEVISLGYYENENNESDNPRRVSASKYILYVGERNHYKNFFRFLKAVSPILRNNRNLILFCAGGGAFKSAELQAISREGLGQNVVQKNVSNAELKNLYRHAELFVFPSLYEGFGYPLIEAFAQACPVVCSNTSSFGEVAGNAAVFFNPLDISEMETAIANVLNDQIPRDELRKKGNEQIKLFTIENSIQKTKEAYRQLII